MNYNTAATVNSDSNDEVDKDFAKLVYIKKCS